MRITAVRTLVHGIKKLYDSINGRRDGYVQKITEVPAASDEGGIRPHRLQYDKYEKRADAPGKVYGRCG